MRAGRRDPKAGRVGDLEIDQDLEFEHREERFERVGWLLMTAFVVAALAGLLGDGPLGEAESRDRGSDVRATFQRFARWRNETPLEVETPVPAGGEVRVRVGAGYLRGSKIEEVVPEPEQVSAGPDHHEFVFRAHPGDGMLRIRFLLRPERPGRLRGWVAVAEGPRMPVHQFVFP